MPAEDRVETVARALGEAPGTGYTTPIVYPWSLHRFSARPMAARPRLRRTTPLRVYLHVPFCRYRCSFCFYAVRTGAGPAEMEAYVDAVGRELEEIEPGTPLAHLFVGGGTPTALEPALLSRLLAGVLSRTEPVAGRVHTVEASPDSLGVGHLDVLREHGIGRVSMGVESLDEGVLETVHRRHGVRQALESCRAVVDAGIALNIDLIYGLPGQTEEAFARDVAAAARVGATSVSLYALRLNEHTPVAAELAEGQRLDLARLLHWRSVAFEAAAGCGFRRSRPYFFERASAPSVLADFAVEQRAAGTGPLLGAGMSARSQVGSVVYRNVDQVRAYVDRVAQGLSPVESVFELDGDDRRTQLVVDSLGNGKPLLRSVYEGTFGTGIDDDFGPRIAALVDGDLLRDGGDRLELTETGALVYDRIVNGFVPGRRHDDVRRLPPPRPARRGPAGDPVGEAGGA